MAEYYDESRNEGPNILGMAGLLGLGALAGAGGYYALRNTKGKNAAAEALTRSARSERPRGVQMTDLGSHDVPVILDLLTFHRHVLLVLQVIAV
jgi:hypothetical protein